MDVITSTLYSWASILDDVTRGQALRASKLPIIAGHVALMPDAHLEQGATIGSVIPTKSAIIPSAVGVDLGCGMVAVGTDLSARTLPDNLDKLLSQVARDVPAGVGRGHSTVSAAAEEWMAQNSLPH